MRCARRTTSWALNDFGAGNYAAFAIMVALYHRLRSGRTQTTHTSLAHTGTFHQVPYMVAHEGRAWDEPVAVAQNAAIPTRQARLAAMAVH